MLTNYHTHSTFCDGINTPEEMVIAAIEKGFSALGFTGHITTPFDTEYCMQDIPSYIAEIKRLKEKYKKDIQIYLGIEEDIYALSKRNCFEYIIGSCHYIKKNNVYYPLDFSYEKLLECLKLFDNNPLIFAEKYYESFCDYILNRRPDIIGHFDLITKFDQKNNPIFFSNPEYFNIAKKYLLNANKSGCIFEVNTGAISRGYRTTPYPNEKLLYELKKADAKIILSSDCHDKEFLDCDFENTKMLLKDIGFNYIYSLYNNQFRKNEI